MKKNCLPFFKDPLILASIIILTVSVVLFSCRKNEVEIVNVLELPQKAKVTPAEIVGWLEKLPGIEGKTITSSNKANIVTLSSEKIPFPVRWDKAKQAIINGKHVVRVPVSKDNFLIFAKESENKPMCAYAFKVRNDKPKDRKFTGSVSWMSFQDRKLRVQDFTNSHSNKITAFTVQNKEPSSGGQKKAGQATTKAFWDFLDALWCYIRGGSFSWDGQYYAPDSTSVGTICYNLGDSSSGDSGSSSSSSSESSSSEIFTFDWAVDLMAGYDFYNESGYEYNGSSGSSSDNSGSSSGNYGGGSSGWTNYSFANYFFTSTVDQLNRQIGLTPEQVTWLNDHSRRALEIYHYLNDETTITEEEIAIIKAHLAKLMTDSEYASFAENYARFVSTSASLDNYDLGLTIKMWWENDYWLDNPNNFSNITISGYLTALGLPNINNVVLPTLLDTTGLSPYPKFKEIVTNLPDFLNTYPNVKKALAYYTGFTEAQVMSKMQPGVGPKVKVVPNLINSSGQSLYGKYDALTKTLNINQSFVNGLEVAQLTKTIQATSLLLAITTFHEFVHYGRDINRLSNLYYDSTTGISSEAGWSFEMNIDPNATGINKYNAISWLEFYPFNF